MSWWGRWWQAVRYWLGNYPPKPDPKGQALSEAVQDDLIQKVEQHIDELSSTVAKHDPQLAAKLDAAARQRKLELERELILRRHEGRM
jgi:hypothetical protein